MARAPVAAGWPAAELGPAALPVAEQGSHTARVTAVGVYVRLLLGVNDVNEQAVWVRVASVM